MVLVSINMCMKICITSFGKDNTEDLISTIYRDASKFVYSLYISSFQHCNKVLFVIVQTFLQVFGTSDF